MNYYYYYYYPFDSELLLKSGGVVLFVVPHTHVTHTQKMSPGFRVTVAYAVHVRGAPEAAACLQIQSAHAHGECERPREFVACSRARAFILSRAFGRFMRLCAFDLDHGRVYFLHSHGLRKWVLWQWGFLCFGRAPRAHACAELKTGCLCIVVVVLVNVKAFL